MKEKNCPCCPNHCDRENLSCGRGIDYFNGNGHHHEEKEEILMSIDEKVMSKIGKCGHYLHHNHNQKATALDFLSQEEKESLVTILSKCLDHWNER